MRSRMDGEAGGAQDVPPRAAPHLRQLYHLLLASDAARREAEEDNVRLREALRSAHSQLADALQLARARAAPARAPAPRPADGSCLALRAADAEPGLAWLAADARFAAPAAAVQAAASAEVLRAAAPADALQAAAPAAGALQAGCARAAREADPEATDEQENMLRRRAHALGLAPAPLFRKQNPRSSLQRV